MTKSNEIIVEAYKKGFRVVGGVVVKPDGTSMYPYLNKAGYPVVTMGFGERNQRRPIPLHRMVAYEKYGDEIFKHHSVRHLNGDKLDNSPENIAVGTHQDNMLDRDPEERRRSARKAAKTLRSLTDEQLIEFRKDREEGFTYSQLMRKYKISKSTVSGIVNNKFYKE